MRNHEAEQQKQRDYYSRTAEEYDALHYARLDEHQFALAGLKGWIPLLGAESVLDIGTGTGRALLSLRDTGIRVVGVEPSEELREIGHLKGLTREELVDGDARKLDYADGEFDLVTAFATLHHVPNPGEVVAEMLRVARIGVFISDSNKFGQGRPALRASKRLIRSLGLWKTFDYLRTGGKGYLVSEGDGLFYSYSIFDDYPLIRRACRSVHLLNTSDSGPDLYRTAPTVAVLGLKRELDRS